MLIISGDAAKDILGEGMAVLLSNIERIMEFLTNFKSHRVSIRRAL